MVKYIFTTGISADSSTRRGSNETATVDIFDIHMYSAYL